MSRRASRSPFVILASRARSDSLSENLGLAGRACRLSSIFYLSSDRAPDPKSTHPPWSFHAVVGSRSRAFSPRRSSIHERLVARKDPGKVARELPRGMGGRENRVQPALGIE